MEETQLPADAGVTGQVLFYSKPEPLNPEQHGKLGVKRLDKPFGFAASTNIVPLTVTEFAPAALTYPVIFVGENKAPVAVLGLNNGENLFVTPEGEYQPDAYVPAYVRRYPFVLANDDKQDRLIVCIDRGSDLIAEGADVALFDGQQPSEYTKGCIEFCNEFENERRRTDQFLDLLKSLDLFEIRKAHFTPRDQNGVAGEPQQIAEYWAVSEDKLNKLDHSQFLRLRDNGALGQIYAHLVSLLGWEKLIAKALVRNQALQRAQAAGNA